MFLNTTALVRSDNDVILKRSGVESTFQFIPRVLCRPRKFFNSNLGRAFMELMRFRDVGTGLFVPVKRNYRIRRYSIQLCASNFAVSVLGRNHKPV